MKKLYASLFFVALCLLAVAQNKAPLPENYIKPYGKIDAADLELKSCDFEPDANAEVLFDVANIYFGNYYDIINERHKRVKIFNTNGKKHADIRIEYYSANQLEIIDHIQAQTINLVNGKPEITVLDKKQIFTQSIDKMRSAIVFSLPNVREGSVIEFKYRWTTWSIRNFPDWIIQSKIPVRYTQLTTTIPDRYIYRPNIQLSKPYDIEKKKDETELRGMINVHSLSDEPFMRSEADNLQRIEFTLQTIRKTSGLITSSADSWPKICDYLVEEEDFGKQFKRKIPGEEDIIAKVKVYKTDEQKIAFLFNSVKNAIKWNEVDRWYTSEGTVKAWVKKSGNSAEVNLILFHLLKQAGVKAYPMLVSTRLNGRINPYTPNLHQFNRTVVYIPIDTARYYVLDATNKYNLYNEVPDNLLNSSGFYIDRDTKDYKLVFLQHTEPVKQAYYLNAEIKPDGKLTGISQISSFAYNKIAYTGIYKTVGEAKFIEFLRNQNNHLKISSISFENMDVDTLPLVQNINFELEPDNADDKYIYFKPNILTSIQNNPFISENRFTDIEFSYRDNIFFAGVFKIPAGFKPEALPKSQSIIMPDKSIIFRRMIHIDGETIAVRYAIDYAKNRFYKQEYPDLREFNRQMYELLNEQIVLKKS
ncbi:DUF3857 domain-containing protein [Mucilaginibacter sp. JRF]|uniref:DUF3857 domain-containing protein n=1 Tax=Mucilaginibacter sp. JRF TaxID=2780088 RepID=UPI00187EBA2F|nr:DUF3857 domain-containing protein [Mucilaginibacter sp. JRF]MBE9586712.1 DUF3857 domain-containing protein [Mucilaginibacter sp. JRF]